MPARFRGELYDRLHALDERYHDYHGTGNDILFDQRITPSLRLKRWIDFATKNLNMNEQQAADFGLKKMEEQGDNIAGNWGVVDTSRLGLGGEESGEYRLGEEGQEKKEEAA